MTNTSRYFSLDQILLGSFFGGPLATTYFLAKNYGAIGYLEKRVRVAAIGVVLSLLSMMVLSFLPPYFELAICTNVLYMGIGYHISKRQQQPYLNRDFNKFGNSRVALIAVCSLILLTLITGLWSALLNHLGAENTLDAKRIPFLHLP